MSYSVVAGQVATLAGHTAKPKATRASTTPAVERLSNHTPRCGTTIHGGRAIAFGAVFVAAGVFILLLAVGVIPTKEGDIHAPMGLIGVCAGIFGLPGLWVVWHGITTIIADRRVERRMQRQPDHPWCYDHAWNENGAVYSDFRRLRLHAFMLLVVGVISVPGHYIALTEYSAAWIAWFFTGLIDLIIIFGVAAIIRAVLRLLRFGRSRIRYLRFPYRRGRPVEVTWLRPRGLRSIAGLTGTLRCIEERYESFSENGQRVVCVAVWSSKWSDETLADSVLPNEVGMTFDLPDGAAETLLRQRPPRYWELEVRGPSDYLGRFLIPVY